MSDKKKIAHYFIEACLNFNSRLYTVLQEGNFLLDQDLHMHFTALLA